jgi:drug/metabolite transporter (DMT)-like permease
VYNFQILKEKEMTKDIKKSIILMLLASLSFGVMGGFAKILSQTLPPLEIAFFRNIFGVAIIIAALIYTPSKSKGGKPILLFFRGFIGFLALLAYFYNMAHIPLGVAVTYNKTAPLFLAFFAWIFLKERLPKSAILALFLGFIGIVLIAKPSGFSFDKYDILGIFSGMGAALAYTSVRELSKYYNAKEISLSFMGVGVVGPIILMLISQYIDIKPNYDFIFAKYIMPHGIEWIYIIFVGLTATVSQLLMTKAYSLTKAGIVGTITYTEIIFGTLIGIMLGDKLPDFYTLVGVSLIVIAGLLVILAKK